MLEVPSFKKEILNILSGEGNGNPLQYSCLENPRDRGAWWAAVHGVARSRTWLSGFTFTFHFHALEKEIATHSSVLAWRIPETGEPVGLPSVGSHRVGHNWSDLVAAAAAWYTKRTSSSGLSFVPPCNDLVSAFISLSGCISCYILPHSCMATMSHVSVPFVLIFSLTGTNFNQFSLTHWFQFFSGVSTVIT